MGIIHKSAVGFCKSWGPPSVGLMETGQNTDRVLPAGRERPNRSPSTSLPCALTLQLLCRTPSPLQSHMCSSEQELLLSP